jgi:hypothetical protein
MSNSSWQAKNWPLFFYVMGGLGVALLFLTPLGPYLREHYRKNSIRVIGVVSGSIHSKGPWVEATKWKKPNGLEIRLMISHFDDTQVTEPHRQDFTILESVDGHTYLNNAMTNIAFANIDEDEWSEIVVPFFESSFVPRLYVLKYDPIIRQFIRVNDRD